MKKIFLYSLCSLLCALGIRAENTVSFSSVSDAMGNEVEIQVSLTNSDAISVVQMTIPLNDYLMYVDGSCSLDSERSNGHSITCSTVGNEMRVVIYSTKADALKGNSGTLFSFRLKLGRVAKVFTLQPTVLLGNASGQSMPVSVSSFQVTIKAPIIELNNVPIDFGHIPIQSNYTKTFVVRNTGTGVLTVSDIQFTVPEMSASETAFTINPSSSKTITIHYAPVNRGALVAQAKVLSDATNEKRMEFNVSADPYSENILSVNGASGAVGEEVEVGISIKNMEPLVSLQWEINLPEGVNLVEGSFQTTSRSSFLTPIASLSNRKVTFVMYSASSQAIEPGDGLVGKFRIVLSGSDSKTLAPQKVVLSNATMENMVSSVNNGSVYISYPTINCATSLNFVSTAVTDTAKATFAISNNGSVDLIVNKVNFFSEGYHVEEEFPLIISPNSTKNITVTYHGNAAGNFATTMNIYSNDPNNKIKNVTIKGSLYEPNSIALSAKQYIGSQDFDIGIALINYTDIVAMQMDLACEGAFSVNSANLMPSSRLAGMSTMLVPVDDRHCKLVIYSMSNSPVVGHDGEIVHLRISPKNSSLVDKTLSVENIVLSDKNGKNRFTDVAPYIVLEGVKVLGDANNDGKVTVSDFTAIANYILGNPPALFNAAAADVNKDGLITVSDLTAIANIILYGAPEGK